MNLSNQEEIRNNRENFILNKKILHPMNKEVMNSWVRCKNLRLDPHRHMVDSEALDIDTLDNITDSMRFFRGQIEEHFSLLHSTLAEVGGCVLYLDSNLSVYAKDGNNELLEKFKALNIKFSTNFAERYTGTTAASIAALTRKPCWVVGSEHYLDILSEYASYAGVNIINEGETAKVFVHLFIVPCNLLTEQVRLTIEFFAMTRVLLSEFSEASNNTQTILQIQMLEETLRDKKGMLLLCDKAGFVLHVSKIFCKVFHTSSYETCGKHINDVLPELVPLVERSTSTQKSHSKQLSFDHPDAINSAFYVTCTPLFAHNMLVGGRAGNTGFICYADSGKQNNKLEYPLYI